MLNLPPALIACEFWAVHSFSKENAAWEVQQTLIYWMKAAFTNAKLTSCIDDVWILGDLQFQQRKYSVQLNQLRSYWIKTTYAQTQHLPSVLMMWILGDSQFQQR